MELCCKKFICDFKPVSLDMAKLQNLCVNPAKLTGCCGRLMCCIGYEVDTYDEISRKYPRTGSKIRMDKENYQVVEVNCLKNEILLEASDGRKRKISLKDYERLKNK